MPSRTLATVGKREIILERGGWVDLRNWDYLSRLPYRRKKITNPSLIDELKMAASG